MKKITQIVLASLIAVALVGCEKLLPPAPEAGDTIAEPTAGLTMAQMSHFIEGDELFAKIYTAEEGLGPIFIQNSCEGCHVGDGKGHPFNTEVRFGKIGDDGEFDYMLDQGGPQLQHRSISNYIPETLPQGHTTTSERIAPIVIGMGHIAAIHDQDILDLEDPNDTNGDGISGRVNYVDAKEYFSPDDLHIANEDGKYIGRFGKKAKEITLLDQVVFALKEDMGLTSDYDTEDLINYEIGIGASDAVAEPEVGNNVVDHLVFYMRTLKTPTRRDEENPSVIKGEEIFKEIGCNKCHVQEFTTTVQDIEAISEKTFYPYTDLLLHDMGEALNDNYPEGDAEGKEWRTPPLWGLGLAADSQGGTGYYLHDGRATSLEDAILLHAGEASGIRDNYITLTNSKKEDLMNFLNSL
ncbi:MAG: di-heme oxidoredictase family protein [Flavobacteriales bacterium]|jgi:CxxC motif-containing protein (DUF1111 family)|tara:strand:+ start:1033 stop:2262 length:1230 start_codon:yes stop_codon:yes gene_type:complete